MNSINLKGKKGMAGKSKNSKNDNNDYYSRQVKRNQAIFTVVAVLLILAMALSAVATF